MTEGREALTRDNPEEDPERKLDVSVVIPVYNEEQNLDVLLGRCVHVCSEMGRTFEIILIDDGSHDRSREMIIEASGQQKNNIVGILLNRNYGQHSAIMAGFSRVRGDIVVTLDADLQNPPEEIPKLVQKAEEGFDVVGSVRVPRQDSLFRKTGSWVVNRMVRASTGVDMHDYGCMLRAYRRPVVEAMLQCEERSTFIPVLANSFARYTTEVDVHHEERLAGDSKYSVWKLDQPSVRSAHQHDDFSPEAPECAWGHRVGAGGWFWHFPPHYADHLRAGLGGSRRIYPVCHSLYLYRRAISGHGTFGGIYRSHIQRCEGAAPVFCRKDCRKKLN